MQSGSCLGWWLVRIQSILLVSLLGACSAPPGGAPAAAAANPGTVDAGEQARQAVHAAAGARAATTQPADADAVSRAAEEYAQRMTQAMAATQPARVDQPASPPPQVLWIDPRPVTRSSESLSGLARVAPAPAVSPTHAPPAEPPAPAAPAPQVAAAPATQPAPVTLSREQLVARLLESVRTGNDPAMARAMTAAMLSLQNPDRKLTEADLAGLDPARQDLVRRYHRLILVLDQQLRTGQAVTDRDAAVSALEDLLGEHPLSIRLAKLCRRVQGYGVYDELTDYTFRAGREQPMIVYCELDHFRSVRSEGDLFQVRLVQELELYTESDGAVVWRQPRVDITDQSRNRRHDFFTVQLIRLPAQLTVGKYRLKIRLTDLGGGSTDETSIALQIVTDQALGQK